MENFKPSLDWAHEFVPSMLWILKTYAITAVLSLLVLVLLAKFTVWGRQYWRITGDYFKGRKSIGGGPGSRCCCCRRSSRCAWTCC